MEGRDNNGTYQLYRRVIMQRIAYLHLIQSLKTGHKRKKNSITFILNVFLCKICISIQQRSENTGLNLKICLIYLRSHTCPVCVVGSVGTCVVGDPSTVEGRPTTHVAHGIRPLRLLLHIIVLLVWCSVV